MMRASVAEHMSLRCDGCRHDTRYPTTLTVSKENETTNCVDNVQTKNIKIKAVKACFLVQPFATERLGTNLGMLNHLLQRQAEPQVTGSFCKPYDADLWYEQPGC
eukprot:m.121883 g.121883  ORF g.121883 m.121883 type:complete len:105 (+) comp11093_c0_seq3:328-642(+)